MFYCLACRIDYLPCFTGQSELSLPQQPRACRIGSSFYFLFCLVFSTRGWKQILRRLTWSFPNIAEWIEGVCSRSRKDGPVVAVSEESSVTSCGQRELERRLVLTQGAFVQPDNDGTITERKKKDCPIIDPPVSHLSSFHRDLLEARIPRDGRVRRDAIQRDESPLQRKSILRSMTHFSCPLTGIRRIAHSARKRPSLRCNQAQRFGSI